MFYEHNEIKWEINNRKIKENSQILGINTLVNNLWIKEEVCREIRKYFELNKEENVTQKNL